MGFFVLNGIHTSQRSQYESILRGKAAAANSYFWVSLADNVYRLDPLYVYRLASILQQPVLFYDHEGKLKYSSDQALAGRNFEGLVQRLR